MTAPTLRFKEFEGAWSLKKIGDISDCIVPGRNKPKTFNGDIPWVTTPDLKNKVYVSDTLSNCYISENEAKNVGSKIVPTNSVVMSCVGDLGLFAINTAPIVINQQLHAFLLDSDKFNPIFILNALSRNQNYIDKVATKTALPYLNKDNCNSIPLFITTFTEQTQIASFLSAVDDKISQLTQKHELLSQYKQGMMQKLFSQQIRFKADDGGEFGEWINSTIGAECKITTGNKDTQNKVDDGTYPFFVRSQTVERINSFSMECEAVLTSGDGVGVGKNYHYINGKFDFHQRVYCLYEFSENIVGKYLYIYFSSYFYDRVKRLSAKNSVDSVRMDMISKMEIKRPCLAEQTKIANFLSAIDQKIEVMAQQIEQAKTWKKGLLQQMFL